MGYINVKYQVLCFLAAVALGMILAIVYNFFKIIRLKYQKGAISVFLSDIMFFAFSAFLTYCFMLLGSKGQVRLFIIFGEIVGFFIFQLLFSNAVLFLFRKMFEFFELILHLSSKISTAFSSTINKYFENAVNTVKKHLQPKVKLLYNYLKISVLKRRKGEYNGE